MSLGNLLVTGGKKLLNKFNYTRSLRLTPYAIKVPIIAGIGRANLKIVDPHVEKTLRYLLNITQESGTFLDVGANIGQTLVKVASIKGTNVSYLGFEPNPSSVFYIERLIELNQFRNAEIVPVGLSNECKVTKMFLSDCVDAGASVVQGFRDADFYSTSKHISLFKGDDVLEAIGKTDISIVKIDTEGEEIGVIRGLVRLLKSAKPFVLCEILPPVQNFSDGVNKERFSRAKQIESEVRLLGYEIFKIKSDGRLIQIDDIRRAVLKPTPDYVFVPKQYKQTIISALTP